MGKTTISRVGRAAVALVLAGGLLAGCAGSPGAAAVVDGRSIPVSVVHEGVEDLRKGPQPEVDTVSVLTYMIIEPTVAEVAAEYGVGISDDQLVAMLDRGTPDAADRTRPYGEGALAATRVDMVSIALQTHPDGQSAFDEIGDRLAALDVEVNPRFGDVNLSSLPVQALPVSFPWIVGHAAE